jgi:hypothetical protein
MVVHFALDAIGLLAFIAREVVFDEEAHLFAPSCVAVRYDFRVPPHILVQGHAVKFRPCLSCHKLLQVDYGQLTQTLRALDGEHCDISQRHIDIVE